MSRPRAILVIHDPQERDDRASAWLGGRGLALDWSCPAAGEKLPALGDDGAAVVVYGGKYDVDQQDAYPFLRDEMRLIEDALARGTPLLGLCLGAQLMAHVLGQKVGPHPEGHAEYGYYDLQPTAEGLSELGPVPKVLQSHWHGWYETPKGATKLAASALFPEQAFRYGRNAYALQFHPEATRRRLEAWIARRPAERHRLPGACPPAVQLDDNLRHDAALGAWFDDFLSRWYGRGAVREAAE